MAREDLPAGVVTLVFTDIEGSTRLLHDLGDRYAEVLADQRRLLRSAFADGGGVEVDTQGDAFFFAFPSARRALLALAQAQRALATHDWPDGRELRVRMGAHTGEPLRTPAGYVGLALHQGARVMACAHGGQVVVSAAAALIAGELDGFALRDLGEHRLKDLSAPQRLFQLCGEGLQRDFPPLRTLSGYVTNLPVQPTPLLGRERELDQLAELLHAQRLVTLTGPGGTGKTRLALQCGAEALDGFPGGVFFCDLAPLTDPHLVATTVALAIGVSEQPGETIEQTLAAYVADKQLLLVLDNFEHVLDAVPVIGRLLDTCKNLRALTTSRAPLRLAGEREFPVESLALPDAVELFTERTSLLGQDALGQTLARGTVEAICERLDRLPLALELAAARLRSLTPDQLLARLEQALALLTGGPRDAPDRQRTLRATLDWSYELLAPTEQRTLAILGVFAGGCTLEAAEQVAGADLDTLNALLEHSLLRRRDERYMMLETVREYALEQLQHAGEIEAARMRHADWALRTLDRADLVDHQAFDPVFVCALAEAELDNLRQAIPFLIQRRPEEIIDRVLAVALIWEEGVQWREGIELVHAISASQAQHPVAVVARVQVGLAWLSLQLGDFDLARESADKGIDAAERVRDDGALIIGLVVRSRLPQGHGEPDPETWNDRALSLARARREPLLICRCLSMLGGATADPDHAKRCYEEARELARANGDRAFEDRVSLHLASIALNEQRYEDAEQMLNRLLRSGLGDSVTTADKVRLAGFVLARRRANREAARLIGASDAELERVGLVEGSNATDRRAAALARIEAAIGKTAAHEALREGRRLQIAEAINLALGVFPQEPEPET